VTIEEQIKGAKKVFENYRKSLNKIEAIKGIRAYFDTGLQQAKDVVEDKKFIAWIFDDDAEISEERVHRFLIDVGLIPGNTLPSPRERKRRITLDAGIKDESVIEFVKRSKVTLKIDQIPQGLSISVGGGDPLVSEIQIVEEDGKLLLKYRVKGQWESILIAEGLFEKGVQ
jgi:hypothetical protein